MRLLLLSLLLCLNVFVVRGQSDEANVSHVDFGRGVPVNVFWSPEGNAFWVVTRINTLWRYDATTMQGELMLEGVKEARYSDDGRFLITRGTDEAWELRPIDDIASVLLEGFSFIGFSPQREWMIIRDDTGASIRPADDPTQVILEGQRDVQFSLTGELVLTDDYSGYALRDRSLTLSDNQPRFSEDTNGVKWLANDEQIAAFTTSDRIDVFNLNDAGANYALFLPDRARFGGIQWSPDETRILDNDNVGNMRVWDSKTGELLWSLDEGGYLTPEELAATEIYAFSYYTYYWSSNNQRVLRCDTNGAIDIRCLRFDIASGSSEYIGGGDTVYWDIRFSPGRRYFALATGLYDAATGEQIAPFEHYTSYREWSGDSRYIAMNLYWSTNLYFYDVEARMFLHEISIPPLTVSPTNAVWSPDNEQLLTWGSWGLNEIPPSGLISLWDVTTASEERVTNHILSGYIASFSSDSSRLAITDPLGNVQIVDPSDDRIIHTLSGHEERVEHLEWQPNGNLLATNDAQHPHGNIDFQPEDSNLVRIWNAVTGELVNTLHHDSPVSTFSWSPSGEQLITDEGADLFVWDVASGEQDHLAHINDGYYSSKYEWSAEGSVLIRYFYSCSHSAGSVQVFDLESFQQISQVECLDYKRVYPSWNARLQTFFNIVRTCNDDPTDLFPCSIHIQLLNKQNLTSDNSYRYEQPIAYTFGAYRTVQNTRWSPDNTRLLVLTGGSADVWRPYLDRAEQEQHFTGVLDGLWRDDGRMLGFTTINGVQVADATSGEVVFTLEDVQSPQWMSDHLRVCRGNPCVAELWNVATGQRLLSGDLPSVVSPNGRYAAGTVNGVFRLWTFGE